MSFDAFIAEGVKTAAEQIEKLNEIADRVIHADNANKVVAEVRENSDDAEIAAWREWNDAAIAEVERRQAAVDALIVSKGLVDTTPVDIATETENYKTINTAVKAMLNGMTALAASDENLLGQIKTLPEIKSLPGVRKTSTGTSGGTGVKRPRIASISVTYPDGTTADIFETKDGVNNANLTVLAKSLASTYKVKVEVKDLQQHLFAAAGTEDLNTLDGKPVEFAYNVVTSDGKSNNVLVKAVPTVK